MVSGLTLQDGNRYLSTVETEVRSVLPKGLPFVYVQSASVVATADTRCGPRRSRWASSAASPASPPSSSPAGDQPPDPPRSYGPRHRPGARGEPVHELWDSLIGTLGMVVVGSLLAGLVAFGLSPWRRSGRCDRYSRRLACGLGGARHRRGGPHPRRRSGRIRGVGRSLPGAHALGDSDPRVAGRRPRPPGPACPRRPSPACASPWSPGWAGAPCRFAPPSWAPSWR